MERRGLAAVGIALAVLGLQWASFAAGNEAAVRARLSAWAGKTGLNVIAASALPDGAWVVVTAHVRPDLLGDRSLERAQLQLVDPAGPRALQSLPLSGPDNHRAETGRVIIPPEKEAPADREPVLNEVELQTRTAGRAVLVFLTQQIHGASWKPTQVDVYRLAGQRLVWTATAGSRGAPRIEDADGDGNPELVTAHAFGWTLSTSSPPLWDETLEWKGTAWQPANSKFPQRYARLLELCTRENERKPRDPDLLLHLARALEAMARHPEAMARAGEALKASAEWSKPQPDAQDRAEIEARIKSFFPEAVIPK